MRTYIPITAIIGVLMLCLGISVCDRCDTAPDTNGCSIPGNLPYFYRNVFESDCNKHDVCYSCGQRRGVSRSDCDRKFYNNIKRTCRTDSRVKNEVWCTMVTLDYYLGVRIGGNPNYVTSSPGWCANGWVAQCLR